MSADQLFLICNYGILPAWCLLIFAPRWEWTQRLVHAVWVPVLLGPVYAWAILSDSGTPDGASFGSLQGVMLFFTSAQSALAGWIHYLVFDLFVGAWELRDAQRRDLPHLAVVPCLVFTLMLGPLGLLLYLLLRFGLKRELSLQE
ncbi:MAG: DUF4281 domain-containing protein [bacterium]|nr:DUF4281 domain-containing protein [bacterium]